MDDLISAREYANKNKIAAELLREMLKHLKITPSREVGRSKMYPVELFDRMIEVLKLIRLDKYTKK